VRREAAEVWRQTFNHDENDPMIEHPVVVVRPPVWVRRYVVVFGVVWFALLLFFAVGALAAGAWASLPIVIVMAVGGTLILPRSKNVSLVAEGDEIVVTNYFTTKRIPRSSVEGFRIEQAQLPGGLGRSLVVLVADGTAVSVDVLRTWWLFGERGRERIARLVAQLEDWRNTK
jgi:hypothetical protein